MAQLCEQTLEISILIKRQLIRATCFANVTYEVCSIIIVSINLVIAKEKSRCGNLKKGATSINLKVCFEKKVR